MNRPLRELTLRSEVILKADRNLCQALHLKDTGVALKSNHLIGRSGPMLWQVPRVIGG